MLPERLQRVINKKFDMVQLLNALGANIYQVPQTLRCPFHEDSRKSAKLFEDGHLYCWTCQRQYGAYDALIALGTTENQIRRMLMEVGVSAEEMAPPKALEVDEDRAKELRFQFRLGKICFLDYMEGAYRLL